MKKIVFKVDATVLAQMLKQSQDSPGRDGVGIHFVKDQGVYLMPANNNVEDRTIVYAQGCDPSKDEDWHENGSFLCGGDDFGEFIEGAAIEEAIKDKCVGFFIKLDETNMQVGWTVKK